MLRLEVSYSNGHLHVLLTKLINNYTWYTNHKKKPCSVCALEYISAFVSFHCDPPLNTHKGSGTYAIP